MWDLRLDSEKPVTKNVLKIGFEVLSLWKMVWLGDLNKIDS